MNFVSIGVGRGKHETKRTEMKQEVNFTNESTLFFVF